MRGVAAILVLAACSPPAPHPPQPHDDAPRIVVAERGSSGGHLVIVSEDGARHAELTTPADGVVRDFSPAFSPDGQWVAFASSRERAFEQSSLWLAPARAGGEAVRITEGKGSELSPAWTPDGGALVFASTRGGGLDLWELAVKDGHADGAPTRLTELPGEEVSPSIAADGRIAFTLVEHDGDVARSRIAILDGAVVHDLTTGPADTGPAWTPDGTRIAFTAPNLRGGEHPGVDGDLWIVAAEGGDPTVVLDVADTDESGPVWSRDGRWLFATSIFRASDASGTALFSSIVFLDTFEPTPIVRMLTDPAGAVPRLSVALGPQELEVVPLHDDPPYRETLASILRDAVKTE